MPDTGVRLKGAEIRSLVPLIETPDVNRRETLCSGMANQFINLVETTFGYKPTVCTFTHGLTGQMFRQLMPGSHRYEYFKRALADITAWSIANGYRAVVPAYIWVQGEADRKIPQWLYEKYMTGYQHRVSADVRQITNQTEDPIVMMAQVSATRKLGPAHPNFYSHGPALAQTALHDRGPLRCIDGFYECDITSDRLHLSSEGQNALGQKIGRKLFDELCGGGAVCFRIIGGRWQARNVFRLTATPPHGDIRILENDRVAKTTNSLCGFEATIMNGNGTRKSLTSAISVSIPDSVEPKVLRRTEIDIIFDPSFRPLRRWDLYWGMRGDTAIDPETGQPYTGNGPRVGGRTLIADSLNAPSLIDGKTLLNNWLTAGQMLDIDPTY